MSSSEKRKPTITVATRPRASSDDSTNSSTASVTIAPRGAKPPSLKSPRAARFAEATAVDSPIEPRRTPFGKTQTNHYMAQPQPSDVGFGYVNRHESVEMPDTDENDYPAVPKTPLKSALKTPGAAPRDLNDFRSPTFRQEDVLEKNEAFTDKQQAADLKVKTRVRMAKMMLRGVNFSCSLIVLAMLSTTFTIFRATRAIPPRNNLPPWAENQKTWPQITLLVIACVSLFASLLIFYAYWKGGHKRAEKAAVYYTAFAVAFFVFSIVMWGVGAGIIQGAKNNSNNKDMWGWSCVNNPRKQLFQNEVSYDLICRLQNWSLVCCIIEVVVETITIAVYGVVFYRFYSKKQLRKSMANRDRARSDLYLAQLRGQSAPNTPGLAPSGYLSPRDGGFKPPADSFHSASDLEDGEGVQYVDPSTAHQAPAATFRLQPPPIRIQGATPRMEQTGFTPVDTAARHHPHQTPLPYEEGTQRSPLIGHEAPRELQQEHFGAAPGEQVYDDVPIPGAYEAPVSPIRETWR
ncbi:hypothetical protein LTR53_005824 [Teratosphaeriaceae sp. CCFEE 6253]|nr:hypothetical protein LTR53_005824 [Teratosphaeriaceae sp. CCFEE 6253]